MSEIKYDKDLWPLGCSWIYPRDEHKKNIFKVMIIGAHPDDPDGRCGGLAYMLSQRGHKVKLVSLTNGSMGHHELGPIELAALELEETNKAAKILGSEYECLNIPDGEVYVNHENLRKVVTVIRKFDPDLVITHRLNDYHRDHRYTSQLVLDASYMLIVPHYFPETPIPESRKMPIFMYCYDHFEKPEKFVPHVMLDISDVYETKAEAMMAHISQTLEWLPWTMNMEDQIPPEYDRKTQKEIIELLIVHLFSGLYADFRKLWKKGYEGKKIIQAEAYEICEYGTQPSKEQLKDLFPGCYIPSKSDLEEALNPSIYKKVKALEKKIKKLEAKLEEKK